MKRRSDIVDAVSKQTNLDAKVASKAVTAVFATILDSLASEESVMITNFGTFEVKEKRGYDAKDPRTQETVRVDTHLHPSFRFSEGIRLSFRDNKQSKYIITTEADNADNECENRKDV